METYRGQKEDEWDVQKIINYKEIDNQLQYEVKQIGYKETTWEPKENLKNAIKKIKEYYKKAGWAIGKRKNQKGTDQLKAMDELPKTKTPPPEYQLFPLQLD